MFTAYMIDEASVEATTGFHTWRTRSAALESKADTLVTWLAQCWIRRTKDVNYRRRLSASVYTHYSTRRHEHQLCVYIRAINSLTAASSPPSCVRILPMPVWSRQQQLMLIRTASASLAWQIVFCSCTPSPRQHISKKYCVFDVKTPSLSPKIQCGSSGLVVVVQNNR